MTLEAMRENNKSTNEIRIRWPNGSRIHSATFKVIRNNYCPTKRNLKKLLQLFGMPWFGDINSSGYWKGSACALVPTWDDTKTKGLLTISAIDGRQFGLLYHFISKEMKGVELQRGYTIWTGKEPVVSHDVRCERSDKPVKTCKCKCQKNKTRNSFELHGYRKHEGRAIREHTEYAAAIESVRLKPLVTKKELQEAVDFV